VEVIAEAPPHDLEAELAYLGSVLLSRDPDAAPVAVSAFYRQQHATLYQAILDAHAAGEPIDAVTIGNRVPDLRSLILDAQNACALPSHAPKYAAIVTDKARLRSLEQAARLVIAAIYEDGAEADEVEADAATVFNRSQQPAGAGALSLHELVEHEIEALNKPQECVYLPGFPGVALYGGDLVVIGARPGHGKSALGMCLALDWSRRFRTAFFSYEMGESQTGRRLISHFSGLSLTDMNLGFTGSDGDTVRALIGDKLEGRDFSYKMSGGMSPAHLFTSLRRFAAGGGRVAIIDYIQLAARARAGTLREDVTVFTNDLKQVALQTGLLIVALSQLRRPTDERALHPPTASELRESGSIEQDADTIFLLMTLPSLRHEPKALEMAQKMLIGYATSLTELEVGDDPDDDKRIVMVEACKVRQGKQGRKPLIFDGANMDFAPCQRSTGTRGAF
jgi:replicative DNA helicase